jgi:hypothetical protein
LDRIKVNNFIRDLLKFGELKNKCPVSLEKRDFVASHMEIKLTLHYQQTEWIQGTIYDFMTTFRYPSMTTFSGLATSSTTEILAM